MVLRRKIERVWGVWVKKPSGMDSEKGLAGVGRAPRYTGKTIRTARDGPGYLASVARCSVAAVEASHDTSAE